MNRSAPRAASTRLSVHSVSPEYATILSSATTRSANGVAPLAWTTANPVTRAGPTSIVTRSASSTKRVSNFRSIPVEPGKNTSIAARTRASTPGGPATISGRVRRLNWPSRIRNGKPPKWSPCRWDRITVSIACGSTPKRRIAISDEAPQSRSIWLAPDWAALANGAAGHAHDFDDTNFALLGHPSVPLLSTALAAAEAEMAGGRTLVLGYILGFEIDVALGTALNPDHYTRGWHATSSIGTLGCAAAAARLMGLDLVQTRHALAIAASHASALKENFGSMP